MRAFLFSLLILALTACSSAPDHDENVDKIPEREYKASFEETWRAVQQAIISYPLRINNMDLGQIQTTPIRGSAAFKPPHETKTMTGGNRYVLNINVIKVGPGRTKVSIAKDKEVVRDFISSPEKKASDGLEEQVIFYRITREISIERTLLRNTKKR
ncbi:MAG: hypothetical protein K2Q26_03055 [Bdellovibrionales bacterium]|nr:hypothetical protein [Bdellovibrionales bacterium]